MKFLLLITLNLQTVYSIPSLLLVALAVKIAIEVFGTKGGEHANLAVVWLVLGCTNVLARVQVCVLDRPVATIDIANFARPRLVRSLVVRSANFRVSLR